MDKDSFKNLIGGIVETRTEWREREREKQQKQILEAEAAAKAKQAQTESANKDPEVTREKDVESAGQKSDEQTDQKEVVQVENGSKSSEAVLFFEDHEQEFIERLYAFIDRPRLAKRFINIYRLLRVRADDEGESATFAARAGSTDFRAALLLLAIHVGHPRVAAKMTQAIQTADGHTWMQLLEQLEKGKCESVPCNDNEREEFAAIVTKLKAIDAVPPDLAPYTRWASRVGCFSFDWHRIPARRPAMTR